MLIDPSIIGDNTGLLYEDLEPHIHSIVDLRREKPILHHSQFIIILYEWLYLMDRLLAILFKMIVAAGQKPPMVDKDNGTYV